MKICLDTNAYSHLAALRKELTDYVEQADEVLVPVVVYGELLGGFALGSRAAKNQRELHSFLDLEGVRVAAVTAEVAERYADLFARLRRAGTPIPTNDLWIAAITMESGARLVTYDKHFAKVPGLFIVAP
jgi:tRNA(fMet)-specific endonuclease VapC